MIPEVAPNAIDITGVDEEADPPTNPNDSTGGATPTQNVDINDIDASPPPEPALITPASSTEQPRQSGREIKTMERYVLSLSGKSYNYNYTQLGLSFLQDTQYKYSSEVVRIVLTQLSLKAALKQWGDDTRIAVEAEAKQLHWRNSFRPVHWKELNEDRRSQILESQVFVKKKRSGQLKARKVAGGNKQRDFIISKENLACPLFRRNPFY